MELILFLLKIRVNRFKYKSRRAVLGEQHIAGHLMVQGSFFMGLPLLFRAAGFVFLAFVLAVFGKRKSISTSSMKKLLTRVLSSKVKTETLFIARNRAM